MFDYERVYHAAKNMPVYGVSLSIRPADKSR